MESRFPLILIGPTRKRLVNCFSLLLLLVFVLSVAICPTYFLSFLIIRIKEYLCELLAFVYCWELVTEDLPSQFLYVFCLDHVVSSAASPSFWFWEVAAALAAACMQIFIFTFWNRVSCSPSYPHIYHVGKDAPNLLTLLSLPSRYYCTQLYTVAEDLTQCFMFAWWQAGRQALCWRTSWEFYVWFCRPQEERERLWAWDRLFETSKLPPITYFLLQGHTS